MLNLSKSRNCNYNFTKTLKYTLQQRYKHTHTHAHIHTNTDTYTHTHKHRHIHTYTQTQTHTDKLFCGNSLTTCIYCIIIFSCGNCQPLTRTPTTNQHMVLVEHLLCTSAILYVIIFTNKNFETFETLKL